MLSERRELGGVVLAAGEGRRMGGPKALLMVQGEPLLVRHVRRFREAGCSRVVVVIPPALEETVRGFFTEAWVPQLVARRTQSPFESLLAAVEALEVSGSASLLVTPVDLRPAAMETLRRLSQAMQEGACAATPRFRGAGGHPVLLARSVLGQEGAAASNLHEVLELLGAARRHVEVEDANVAQDFNTASEFTRLFAHAPRFAEHASYDSGAVEGVALREAAERRS